MRALKTHELEVASAAGGWHMGWWKHQEMALAPDAFAAADPASAAGGAAASKASAGLPGMAVGIPAPAFGGEGSAPARGPRAAWDTLSAPLDELAAAAVATDESWGA